MSVDFATFSSVVPHILSARLPVLLRGRHGVGKSQVVYQIAKDLSLPVVERRASQMTEGDLLGLPDTADTANGRKCTTWNAPDWLVTACDEPVLLFLDEVDRAKMDPAELDRWTVFDVEPTTEDWLKWATDNVDGILWDFINHNRSHLEHTTDYEPNKVYPSRRSWKRLNDTVAPTGVFDEEGDLDLLFTLATAFVGFEAAVSLRDFVEKYEWQVTIEDILDRGEIAKTEKWGINDHAAMIEKFDAAKTFAEPLTEAQIANVAEYFVSLPSEVAMKLWTVIGDSDTIENTIALHKAETSTGTRVSDHLVEILGGTQS